MTISRKMLEEFVERLDKFALKPVDGNYIITVDPAIWNGYWYIRERSRLLRRAGRFLHSKHIYALGLYVEWVKGLKEYGEFQ